MSSRPKVIIRCLVYNHEPYLRDCLEGFVMQKTNFPFKAVVHDDCSTDGSAAIIREYAEKYPDIIEPIFETENLYSRRDGSLLRVMSASTYGRSEYIALCEGDDYWIDPYKLQKQVDFLESNLDYTMCFSACKIRNENNLVSYFEGGKIQDRDYDSSELLKNWIVPTVSIMMRSFVAEDKRMTEYDKRKFHGDIICILTAADHGKVRGMSDVMTVYRLQPSSVMQRSYSNEERKGILCRLFAHYSYIKEKYPKISKKVTRELRWRIQKQMIESPFFQLGEKIVAWARATFIAPRRTFYLALNYLKRRTIRRL